MPAILQPEVYEAQLSPETANADAKALLRPYEAAMIACPVSKAFGSRRTTHRG